MDIGSVSPTGGAGISGCGLGSRGTRCESLEGVVSEMGET